MKRVLSHWRTNPIPDVLVMYSIFEGMCMHDAPIQLQKCLKLKMVLKWRDTYIEKIRTVPLIASLKMEGIVNRGVLNHRDHCNV